MARASRVRNGLSSSTISSDLSLPKIPASRVSASPIIVIPELQCFAGHISLNCRNFQSALCPSANCGFGKDRRSDESGARPDDLDRRALPALLRIAELDRGAGALEQRLGDE